MPAKFELKRAIDGKYVFNLKSTNGETVLTSQTYASRGSALSGVESVRKNVKTAARFERKVAKNGAAYFVLLAANGKQIGRSETYSSPNAMEKGIESVRKHAGAAKLEDRR
jgi:uncharacterized protein YegP (UPF0339 family)